MQAVSSESKVFPKVSDVTGGNYQQKNYASCHRWSEVAIINPDEARWILDHLNDENPRAEIKSSVKILELVIRQGRFQTTHQGIAFFQSGKLADGQNRLRACANTGIPIRVMITYGVTREEMAAIDQGKSRTISTIAKTLGREMTPEKAAVVNCWFRMHGQDHGERQEPIAIMNVYDFYASAIDFSIEQCRRPTRSALIRAAVAKAWYHVPIDRLSQFCEVMVTGIPEDRTADVAAIRFRNYFLGLDEKGRQRQSADISANRREIVRKCMAAIAHFVSRQPIAKLVAASTDIYPLPLMEAKHSGNGSL